MKTNDVLKCCLEYTSSIKIKFLQNSKLKYNVVIFLLAFVDQNS